MICTFYTCNDDNNKISKSLINPLTKNLKIRNDFDTDNPILILTFNPLKDNRNYVYLNQIYYFIESVDIYKGRLYKANLHIDVLKTYESEIKDLQANIIYSQNPDIDFVNTAMSEKTKEIEYPLNDIFDREGKIYLTTVYTTQQ